MGISMPLTPATSGTATRRRSRSSPMSNSRRASSPTMKKKNVISPLFSQYRRSSEIPRPPMRIESTVCQTRSYEDESAFTHTSAATAAASRTAALPVSVRRKLRNGVSRFRAHAVRPEKGAARGSAVTALLLVALDDLRRPFAGRIGVEIRVAQRTPLAQQVPVLVERDLQLLQAPPVGVGGVACGFQLPQLVLLGDELLDLPVNLRVVHHASFGCGLTPTSWPAGHLSAFTARL